MFHKNTVNTAQIVEKLRGARSQFSGGLPMALLSNYDPILSHFQDKGRYCSNITIFHTSPAFNPRVKGTQL